MQVPIAAALTVLAALQSAPLWIEGPVPEPLSEVEARAVETTSEGQVWFAVAGRGLAQLSADRLIWFTDADGLASNGIADLLKDSRGRLWAVGLGGVAVRDAGDWRSLRHFGSMAPRVVFGVYEDTAQGHIWLAANGGAARSTGDGWAVLTSEDGLPHAVVHAAVADSESVWLLCRSGLARVVGGDIEVFFPTLNFRSAVRDHEGRVWFGTSDGIVMWNRQSWHRELIGVTVYPRVVAKDGSIWAGSADSGVYVRRPGSSWIPVPLPHRLRGAEVFDVAEGSDGSMWVATSRGVGRLIRSKASPP